MGIDAQSKGDIEEDLGDESDGQVNSDQTTGESLGGESCGEQCWCCDAAITQVMILS